MLIDTHTHIYLDHFDQDRQQMIRRATDQEVEQLYLPNIDVKSINKLKKTVKDFPGVCKGMMGLHPCSVKKDFTESLQSIKSELFSGDYVAVGEIGIDLYWEKSLKEEQIQVFEMQINWALDLDIPIVIHSRESLDETIRIVSKHQDGRLRGVFHCFTGTLVEARQIMDLGFYLGIGGVLTFKNAGLDVIVRDIPMEHLVLETDSPYLAPMPYRGKRNESSYIVYIAKRLAEVKRIRVEKCAEITSRNAKELFGD